MLFNYFMCIAVVIVLVAATYIIFFRKKTQSFEAQEIDPYNFEYICNGTKEDIDAVLRQHPEDLNLNEFETKKLKKQKDELKKNISKCTSGDIGAKSYVKDYISSILQQKRHINETNIDKCIPFEDASQLTTEQKYYILLNWYENQYDEDGFSHLLKDNGFDQLREGRFYVGKSDIEVLYNRLNPNMDITFTDKMNILTQLVYQKIYGHGCVDQTRDSKIDGISVGVSGIPSEMFSYSKKKILASMEANKGNLSFSYDSVWVLFEGKQIHLNCLGCHSEKELQRVCKNLYKYKAKGNLSENRGFIFNTMKDGSRVSVARPPFSDSWFAIVRKHSAGMLVTLEDQISGVNSDKVITIIKSLILGEKSVVITGGQGCGKTTLMRNLISTIRSWYTIRVEESVVELNLRQILTNQNILSFCENDVISGQDALNFSKKTDTDVLIMGEVAEPAVAAWLVQSSQTGGPITVSSNHALTTPKLLSWFRNALLRFAGFSSERVAMEQAVDSIPFDLHMKLYKATGERFAERLTEVIPVPDERQYILNDIFSYDVHTGKFTILSRISPEKESEIMENLFEDEKAAFMAAFEGIKYRYEDKQKEVC